MAQRVRIPHRGQRPSSARQLPILAALYARSPTLFVSMIHHRAEKVNSFFIFGNILNDTGRYFLSFVYYVEKSSEKRRKTLAFCALLLYNKFHSEGEVAKIWAS